jgi:hypothetical protein
MSMAGEQGMRAGESPGAPGQAVGDRPGSFAHAGAPRPDGAGWPPHAATARAQVASLAKSLRANKCVNRDAPKFRVMAGAGRPPTSFLRATQQSRGWPAFSGHDTGDYDAAAVDSVVSPRALSPARRVYGRPGAPSPSSLRAAAPGQAPERRLSTNFAGELDLYQGVFRRPRPSYRIENRSAVRERRGILVFRFAPSLRMSPPATA